MRVTSFRMVGGRVRGLSHHFARLGLSAAQQDSVRTQLRAAGPAPCFPLIDATGCVTIRPDHPFSSVIAVDPMPHLDERSTPTVKGPDLPWLASRFEMSKQRGFDEGILTDERGMPVEAIFSALVVWRDGPVLSVHPRALSSTTAHLVEAVMEVDKAQLTPADLQRPMWLLNAFSGVRTTNPDYPVSEINQLLWDLAEQV